MANNGTLTAASDTASGEEAILKSYWRSNLILMSILMFIWAFISLGCGVLWADWLNQWELPGTGYPLGFWFAQQGSILGFVALILVYALLMNRLDKAHHADRERLHLDSGEEESGFRGDGI